MTGPRIVTADDLCAAAEAVLRADLYPLVEAAGQGGRLKPIATYQQLPVQAAIATANLPAIGISSPGLIGRPAQSRATGWTATWRINVGVYDRGADHHDTAARVRDWAAYIRAVLVASRSLQGAAASVTWATEEYALYPQAATARTFAAAAVGIDVFATNVMDLDTLPSGPVVRTTETTVHPEPAVLRASTTVTVQP